MLSPKLDKVAVLLATYNGENWVEEQLTSICQQENVELSIFISDDLSTDKTLDICSKFQMGAYPSIFILPSEEKFGGAGKNFYRLIGDVDFTEFDYICLSDQDDIWNFDKLKNAISQIRISDSDCYSSNITAFYESGKTALIHKAQQQTHFDYNFEAAGPGCTYVFKVAMALELKKFIKKHRQSVLAITLHDWFIYAFARTNGYKWYIDNQSSMMYRQHHNNQVGANITLKAKFKRLAMVKNKWYRNQVKQIANLFPVDGFILRQLNAGYRGNLVLALNFWKLRRKGADKLLLLIILLLNIF